MNLRRFIITPPPSRILDLVLHIYPGADQSIDTRMPRTIRINRHSISMECGQPIPFSFQSAGSSSPRCQKPTLNPFFSAVLSFLDSSYCWRRRFTYAAMPPISPPPPTATKIVSIGSRSWRRSPSQSCPGRRSHRGRRRDGRR